MKKIKNIDYKAKKLERLFKQAIQTKKELEKNGYEVITYMNENILIVRKRII